MGFGISDLVGVANPKSQIPNPKSKAIFAAPYRLRISDMKKILVTGASGFLGWHVCRFSQENWQVVGAFKDKREGIPPKTDAIQLDLTNKDLTWKALKETRPTAVFHLAAHSDTGFCEKRTWEGYQLNVEATTRLVEMCAERRIRFVFTSSEQVFDGLKGNYAETDLAKPSNEYGKQKLTAEKRVEEIYPDAVIARISVLYGASSPVRGSFLSSWLDAWQKFLGVTAFHDEIRTFLSADAAAEGLFLLLEQGANGIFHIAGENPMSRYDFAMLAKQAFNLPAAKVVSRSQKEMAMASFRPPNLSLICDKIRGIGYQPRSVEAELQRLAKEIEFAPFASNN